MRRFIGKNYSNDQALKIIDEINTYIAQNKGISDIEITINNKRTLKQNNALHKYFSLISEEFNNRGLDFSKTFKEDFHMIVTPDIVKENLWKPVQKAYYGTVKTRQLKKEQIDKIYDTINKKLSEKFGIYVPFPNKEDFYK